MKFNIPSGNIPYICIHVKSILLTFRLVKFILTIYMYFEEKV